MPPGDLEQTGFGNGLFAVADADIGTMREIEIVRGRVGEFEKGRDYGRVQAKQVAARTVWLRGGGELRIRVARRCTLLCDYFALVPSCIPQPRTVGHRRLGLV